MSVAATVAPAVSAAGQATIRVMVVDDAVVVRGLVSRWIEEEPGLEVVASLRTGRDAVAQIERVNPDVVVLDLAGGSFSVRGHPVQVQLDGVGAGILEQPGVADPAAG